MKISVYVAMSIDGFIARDDHSVDWLPSPTNNNEDFGFNDFFSSVDVMIMGRNTFDTVINSGYQWPYQDKKVFILTSRDIVVPKNIQKFVSVYNGTINALVDYCRDNNLNHIYIDGAQVIQSFLKLNLVNEITITQIPILLGSGISLFSRLNMQDVHLSVISSKLYDNHLMKNHYKIDASITEQ